MSFTSSLTNRYGMFFTEAGRFSVSPYTATWDFFGGNATGTYSVGPLIAFTFCAALTITPVLPVCTLITISLAMVATTLAALSSLIAYPVAVVCDLVDAAVSSESSFSNAQTF